MGANLFLIFLLAILLSALALYWRFNSITVETAILTDWAEKVAKGDFSGTWQGNFSGERKNLARALSSIASNLKKINQAMDRNATTITDEAQRLFDDSSQIIQAAEDISLQMEEITAGTAGQLEENDKINASLSHISQQIQGMAGSARAVYSNSLETTEKAREGSAALDRAVRQMDNTSRTVEQATMVTSNLDHYSKEIGEITGIISDIAEQTNLLALNAAIEAARAKEHGRGFSVVAEEVKKLAEQSARASDKINSLIVEIQKQIREVMLAMGKSQKEVQEGVVTINQAGKAFQDILLSIDTISKETANVSDSSQVIAQISREALQSMEYFRMVNEKISLANHKVTDFTQEQTASIEGMTLAIDRLTQMSKQLKELIGNELA